jgi:hypothetical protein
MNNETFVAQIYVIVLQEFYSQTKGSTGTSRGLVLYWALSGFGG